MRLVRPLESTLGCEVAEGGGESIGSRGESQSGELPPVNVDVGEEEVEEGVIGRGLSGEGVRGTARSGGTFGFRKCPSMTMSAVG